MPLDLHRLQRKQDDVGWKGQLMADEALALRAMKKIKEYQAKQAEYDEAIEHLKEVVANNLPLGETELDDVDEEDRKSVV